jgi:hypothetical protein
MEALEATMKNHNINRDSSSSNSSSHGHVLDVCSFSFNAISISSSNEWLIDSRASYHMVKDKAIFSALDEYNTKRIFDGDGRSLSVVGSGIVQLDWGTMCSKSLIEPSINISHLSFMSR